MSLHGNEPVFELVEEADGQAVAAAEATDSATEAYDPDLEDDRDGEDK